MPSLPVLIQMASADVAIAARHAKRSNNTAIYDKRQAVHRLLVNLQGRPGLVGDLVRAGILDGLAPDTEARILHAITT